jgi:RNA polymerase sigma-70 factor, ECF subfamily
MGLSKGVVRIPFWMDTPLHFSTPHWPAGGISAGVSAPTLLLSAMTTNDDLKALAAGLRRRDPRVIDRLVEQYQYRLFRYLVYLTASRERAEDFFQGTWIRVLERGYQYDGQSRFETWLFSIARYLVIDWQRRNKAQSLDSLLEPEIGAPVELVDGATPSPLSIVLTREEASVVQTSLERVPAIHREVLLLRFQEDMPLADIAHVLGVPLATVKSRLYRGLENLRSLLTLATA